MYNSFSTAVERLNKLIELLDDEPAALSKVLSGEIFDAYVELVKSERELLRDSKQELIRYSQRHSM